MDINCGQCGYHEGYIIFNGLIGDNCGCTPCPDTATWFEKGSAIPWGPIGPVPDTAIKRNGGNFPGDIGGDDGLMRVEDWEEDLTESDYRTSE